MTPKPAERERLDLDLIRPAGQMLFAIEGMWCGSCARALEAALGKVPGITQAGVHFATCSALIRWDPTRCDLREVDRCVRGMGYRLAAALPSDEVEKRLDDETRAITVRIAIAAFFGMWSMAAALALYADEALAATPYGWWLALTSGLLAAPALLSAALPFYRAGWRTAKAGAPSLDSLVSLGVVGSVFLSVLHLFRGSSVVFFDTATMLIALLLVGRLMELTARRRALIAIRALESVVPERAQRLTDAGGVETIAAEVLSVGDCILVDAGSVCPADGVVQEGTSAIDRSALTGESRPLRIRPGDAVEAATVNLLRRLTVKVTRRHGEREIDLIGGHVAAAIGMRGETQRIVDRLAQLLAVSLPLLAAATALGALWLGRSLDEALIRALTVMVVACPCALSIATPVAFVAAATKAACQGLLLRDPAAFERLAGARTVIFDKTGTLSEGKPCVSSMEPAVGWDERSILAVAAQAESGIDHPIARAIIAAHGRLEGAGGEREKRKAKTVDADGRELVVEAAQADEEDAATCLRITVDGTSVGTIRLIDAPRTDAAAAVRAMRCRGLAVILATGDAIGPARTLAAQVDIRREEIRAACQPADKLDLVRAVRGPVLFVGDGVNDGPALAAADCGMAIEGAHAGARALAAVVISRGGALAVVAAYDLARRTKRIMHENLGFSLVYNVGALLLAAGGAIQPVAAASAMLLSSLSVGLNALRLTR